MTIVIFLDMDGVISTRRAWLSRPHDDLPDRWIDAEAMGNLNRLIKESGAVVVVSSTWRLDHKHDEPEGFKEVLDRNGFVGMLHSDWRTKDLVRPMGNNGLLQAPIRGDEVAEWLLRHPEVTHYVILDDDSDFHAVQPHVKTGFEIGLTADHVTAALNLLVTP